MVHGLTECVIMTVSAGAGLQSAAGDRGHMHVEAGAGLLHTRLRSEEGGLRGGLRVVFCLFQPP